ncbi:transcriptional regulator [Lactobacillus sp. CBA3605]|uniref:LacI family DNA-binding transcriptional regulator n=1 Tax=Lactobacillus sp. CBA3605 TaxID=2099788 RepID=UPI000CFC1CBD|nr:LacI family DNA-binding transcriptional regulator [Lactobacillus sp. CBA3605]AVK61348.1 transcriptional regulator [Lactobacillus sp. CBA3605]
MTTIREIAAQAGYSPATVSRLLNNDPTFSISDTARKRILKTVQSLNYQRPNTTHGLAYKIAVIFSVQPQKELADVYYSNLRKSIIDHGDKANLVLTFYHNIEAVPTPIDGLIAVGQFRPNQLQQLQSLSPHRIFVDANPDPHHFSSVQPNLMAMTERAINLFRQQHRTPIGFIGGGYWNTQQSDTGHLDDRRKFFESYMRELNLYDDRFVFIGKDFSVESGYALGQKIVASQSDQSLPKGFLIASDSLSVGVLQAFNENKITVPTDTTIISINDIDIARYVSPPLTTFRIDTNELGRVAIDTLKAALIFKTTDNRTILLDANLIYRKSFPKLGTQATN